MTGGSQRSGFNETPAGASEPSRRIARERLAGVSLGVSPKAYEFSKAIYGACLSKSDDRLDKIETMLDDLTPEQLPPHERQWLTDIVNTARADHWEAASKQARSMMEDQAVR